MSVMIKEICRTLHVILLIKIILFLLINLLWFSLLQVQKIDIGYAKTAKKMDVKKLKGAMWGLLADKGESDKVGWLNTLPDCWQSSYHEVKDLVFLTSCLFQCHFDVTSQIWSMLYFSVTNEMSLFFI